MAAQTDAPDDLIAELARLMADDARESQPPAPQQQPASVRIPGDTPTAPVPRFDFSASTSMAASQAPASPVRIPGGDPIPSPTPAPSQPQAAKPAANADPFSFDFDLSPASRPAAPATPAAAPATVRVSSPAPAAAAPRAASPAPAPQSPVREQQTDSAPDLDQDSLADLIAAELASDMGGDLPSEPHAQSQQPQPAPRPTSADSFGVPPVFGLGTAPAQPAAPTPQPVAAPTARPKPVAERVEARVQQPSQPPRSHDEGHSDPLDEIERLVGPAVRMNSEAATPAASVASPAPSSALRSLATPVIPPPEPQADRPVHAPQVATTTQPGPATSVDEAILAAAAATGAHVEWVNPAPGAADDVDADRDDYLPPPRSRNFRINRAVAGPLVAVGLLAVAGGGLYFMLGQGGGPSGPAPLVVADTAPTKEVPEAAPPSAQQSVVFNEISGNNVAEDEQIVSRDQADTEAVVAANTPVVNSGVLDSELNSDVDPNQDGLVNRRVRTVTVRPDGTIVSGNDSLAGSSILPVDRPNVPEVPGADTSTPDLIASAIAETEAAVAPTPVTAVPPATATNGPVAQPGASIAVANAAGAVIPGRTVTVPQQRPADFASIAAAAISAANAAPAVATQPTAPATLAPAPAQQQPAPVAAAPAGNAPAYVQMASQRSEAEAQATVQAITTRYGVLFGGATPEIRRADLGERGIYYRVLIPASSRESAANICANVKAAGGDCLLQ